MLSLSLSLSLSVGDKLFHAVTGRHEEGQSVSQKQLSLLTASLQYDVAESAFLGIVKFTIFKPILLCVQEVVTHFI